MMLVESVWKVRKRLEMAEQAIGASGWSKPTPPRQNVHGSVPFLARRPHISSKDPIQ
jgi:hypothetical protein